MIHNFQYFSNTRQKHILALTFKCRRGITILKTKGLLLLQFLVVAVAVFFVFILCYVSVQCQRILVFKMMIVKIMIGSVLQSKAKQRKKNRKKMDQHRSVVLCCFVLFYSCSLVTLRSRVKKKKTKKDGNDEVHKI